MIVSTDTCGVVPPHRNPVDAVRRSRDVIVGSKHEGNAKSGWPKAIVQKLVAADYEPATVHEK